MKKFILSCAIVAAFSTPTYGEDKTKLTPDEIQGLMDMAKLVEIEKEHRLRDGIDEFGTMNIINPSIDWNSDTSLLCADAGTRVSNALEIPRDEGGEPDPSQLPDNCTILHKTVARPKHEKLKDVPVMLRKLDPVDELASPE